MPEWVAVLPPLVAVVIAIWKKEVIPALLLGIWVAETFWSVERLSLSVPSSPGALPFFFLKLMFYGAEGMMERIVSVFSDGGNTRVLLFGLLVGALLELIRVSGGVGGFVAWLTRVGLTRTPRRAGVLTSLIGTLIFVETSMSCLAAGVVSQPLYDRFKMSRARLAFILDGTCAPISVMILFNGWGAHLLGLLQGQGLNEQSVSILISAVPLNFYPILIIAVVWFTVLTGRLFGPLKTVDEKQELSGAGSKETLVEGPARFMVVPMILLVAGMFVFMFYTGDGDLRQGSGSRSVLWSVAVATFVLVLMLLRRKTMNFGEITETSYQGVGKLVPVVLVMLLSFAIGGSCKALGTGDFVAGFFGDFLSPILVAPLLFIAAAFVSFTTGTSWGTFAILIPVAVPLGTALGVPLPLAVSAVMGGGVFGDHCSPISDTTIIASLAAECDHLDHVKTQLPYAVAMGGLTLVLYVIAFPLLT